MEAPKLCEKCKKLIVFNQIIENNKYYHKKCIHPENEEKEDLTEEKLNFIKGNRRSISLIEKYKEIGKSLISEVVRPYFQFKYQIKKNKYLELIPQIAMYFPDMEEEKAKQFIINGGIESLKKELLEILGEDFDIVINNIVFGSWLCKINIFWKKINSFGKKGIQKLKEFLTGRSKEVEIIKKAVERIKNKRFKCIKNLKPMAVIFINQDKIQNEEVIKNFLNEQMTVKYDFKKSWTFEGELNEMNLEDNLNEDKINNIFNYIHNIARNEEEKLLNKIKKVEDTEKINQKFTSFLEKAFKESIFEFKIIGLVVVNKDDQRKIYEKEKNQCPNCETKILFHATEIQFSSNILTSNFKIGKDNWYGSGIYFSDQFDYVKYYYKREDNFATIPKLNDSFNIIVSEIYYDKTKLKQIYDDHLHLVLNNTPTDEELKTKYKKYSVEKNGIHYIEVDGGSGLVLNGKNEVYNDGSNKFEKISKDRFIGREYCITCKEQIYPLYGLNFQQVDYCVIWRYSNFENSFIWEEPLRKNKELIKEMTGYNLYTESNIKEALKLIWRKRFNKIILITNVGKNLEGKKLVDKVRKILEFNVMVLFFTDNLNHLNWIKDYPNSLFCTDDYTLKNYIFNFNEEGINTIREQVKEFYGVELSMFDKPFDYPLFEKYKDSYFLYSQIDCSEYNDFSEL